MTASHIVVAADVSNGADAKPVSARSLATTIVWSTWAVMLLVALACIVRYGRNIPLAEDWLLVPPMTGHEPHLGSWLWAQNNEHRLPLPRLVLLGLLMATRDFRAGMVLNVVSLAALAAAMIFTARHLRGGETRLSDAFFPLALLHLGDWANLIWGWQFQFVSSAALTCTLLLVVVRQREVLTAREAVVASVTLILLPLTGANGLIFALALAPWAAATGLAQRRATLTPSASRTSALLLTSAIVAPLLVGAYFIGYVKPWWNPPNPGRLLTLKTTTRFLALAWGAAAGRAWLPASVATIVLLVVTALVLLIGLRRARGGDRLRGIGVLLFAGGCVVLALAIGWGRAATDLVSGMPMRYVLLSVPTLCATYFVWELYAPVKPRRWLQAALCLTMVVLLPWNTFEGFGLPGRYDVGWRGWYVSGMTAVEQDVRDGVPRLQMAARHREFLMHWDEAKLAAGMRMLLDAQIGPFSHLRDER
jgi:hypothetical protein